MAPVNFAGKLPVLVALVWEGEVVANAPTRRFNDFRYVIANDLVSSFTILLAGAGPGAITRTTTPGGKKKFDKALNTYRRGLEMVASELRAAPARGQASSASRFRAAR